MLALLLDLLLHQFGVIVLDLEPPYLSELLGCFFVFFFGFGAN